VKAPLRECAPPSSPKPNKRTGHRSRTRLDISPRRVQIPTRVTKSRVTTSVVCLLYLSVALFFGVVHHHHDEGPCDHDHDPCDHHHDCAACQWQLNAITDVPNVLPILVCRLLETPLETFDFISYSAPSLSFSPSRAPPLASA